MAMVPYSLQSDRTAQGARATLVCRLLACFVAAAITAPADAQIAPPSSLMSDTDGVSYEVSAGVRASDNYARTADSVSGAMASAGFALDALRRTGRLQYDGGGDLALVHYFNGNFGSEVLGKFDMKSDYAVSPELFHWVLHENFGQVVKDYFAAPGPQNRQYLNTFSTGPDVRLRLGAAGDLRLSGRYGRDDYQSSGYSARHLGGEAALERRPTPNILLDLGASTDKVDYFEQFAKPGNFQLRKYFAGYQFGGRVSTLNLVGGYADTVGGLAQLHGAVGRIDIERHLTASSLLSVGVRRALQTVTEGSRASDYVPGAAGFSTAAILTGSLYFAKTAEIGFTHRKPRTSFSAWADYIRETDHRDVRPDRDAKVIATRLTHKLTPLSEIALSATWSHDLLKNAVIPGFPVGDYRSTERAIAITFRKRMTQVLFMAIDLTNSRREAAIQPFAENAVWVRLGYSPHFVNLAGRYNE